jgi:predicted lipoprotein with Yx(FWY)xxD motif
MKNSYAMATAVASLAVLAFAVSACGPSPASAASSQGATGKSSTSGSYGYGSSVQATTAPTQGVAASSGGYGSGSAASATAAPTQAGAAVSTVNAGSGALGSYLVDSKGMTLYIFLSDTPGSGTSTCSGGCASAWPALTASSPTAGSGVDASKLGTITRADGGTQVTYNGWPLYYYAKDVNPGDTLGQGIKSVWYVVSPAGDAVK